MEISTRKALPIYNTTTFSLGIVLDRPGGVCVTRNTKVFSLGLLEFPRRLPLAKTTLIGIPLPPACYKPNARRKLLGFGAPRHKN